MGTAKNNRQARRIEKNGMHWHCQAVSLIGLYREDGKGLSFTVLWNVEDQEYVAVALTVPSTSDASSVEKVLEDHAHKTLGNFSSELLAKDACRTFAIEWLRSGNDIADPCECEPIADTNQRRENEDA